MNPLLRWTKFNLVGGMGMVVQLTLLAILNRHLRGHYLLASGIAVEIALLHNFLWHIRYTWRDRARLLPAWKLLVRFHLATGLVSLTGNLALMRLLVKNAHLPVVIANLVTILCCSSINFRLSDLWAFSSPSMPEGCTS